MLPSEQFLQHGSLLTDFIQLHPRHPRLPSGPGRTSGFWSSLKLRGWAALPVLGRSFWGDVCLGGLWPLCLGFSLSLEVAVGGHHVYFSIRLLLVVPRREEIVLTQATPQPSLPRQPPTPTAMPCPGYSTPQGLPLHMCGWLPVFLALPISHPQNGCRLQGSFSAPWGFLSAGTPSHITVPSSDVECNCARADCLCE